MEAITTSSSNMVQTRLMSLIKSIQIPDEQIEKEIGEYFAANPTSSRGTTTGETGYIYNRQGIPAASWIIDHNLGRYPQITLIDDEGYEFEADILYNSLNQVTVVLSQPISGKAVLS